LWWPRKATSEVDKWCGKAVVAVRRTDGCVVRCGVVWCGVVWCGVVWCVHRWLAAHAGLLRTAAPLRTLLYEQVAFSDEDEDEAPPPARAAAGGSKAATGLPSSRKVVSQQVRTAASSWQLSGYAHKILCDGVVALHTPHPSVRA
jgi:hypothetical protein